MKITDAALVAAAMLSRPLHHRSPAARQGHRPRRRVGLPAADGDRELARRDRPGQASRRGPDADGGARAGARDRRRVLGDPPRAPEGRPGRPRARSLAAGWTARWKQAQKAALDRVRCAAQGPDRRRCACARTERLQRQRRPGGRLGASCYGEHRRCWRSPDGRRAGRLEDAEDGRGPAHGRASEVGPEDDRRGGLRPGRASPTGRLLAGRDREAAA